MANCLRNIKYTVPNYNQRQIHRQLSCLAKNISSLTSSNDFSLEHSSNNPRCHEVAASQSAPCSPYHPQVQNNRCYGTAPGLSSHTSYSIESDDGHLIIESGKSFISKSTKHSFNYSSQPDMMSIDFSYEKEYNENNCVAGKNGVRVFKLPPNALWYPPGATRCGPDIFYSVSYSPLEQEVMDEALENLPVDVFYKGHCITEAVSLSGAQPRPSLPALRVYDMAAIMQNKDLLQEAFHLSSSSIDSSSPPQKQSPAGVPSPDQLKHVNNTLQKTLPSLFVKPMDYSIYETDVIFENRLRGTITHGLPSYIKQTLLLRTIGHLKFGSVKFEIMSVSTHPEDGTICMRWRIIGISGFKIIANFWNININHWKEAIDDNANNWYAGFSTFYVNGNGCIYKHVADYVVPNKKPEKATNKILPTALAALIGLKPSMDGTAANVGLDGSMLTQLQTEEDWLAQLMFPSVKL